MQFPTEPTWGECAAVAAGGGIWRSGNDPESLVSLTGEPVPSLEDLEAARQVILAERIGWDERIAKRAAMRAQWMALPAYIRGPYDDAFAAVERLLDAGDDAAARALIEFREAKVGYSVEQLAAFVAAKGAFLAAIDGLGE